MTETNGAPRASPCLRAEVRYSTQAWSPKYLPTYAKAVLARRSALQHAGVAFCVGG